MKAEGNPASFSEFAAGNCVHSFQPAAGFQQAPQVGWLFKRKENKNDLGMVIRWSLEARFFVQGHCNREGN